MGTGFKATISGKSNIRLQQGGNKAGQEDHQKTKTKNETYEKKYIKTRIKAKSAWKKQVKMKLGLQNMINESCFSSDYKN